MMNVLKLMLKFLKKFKHNLYMYDGIIKLMINFKKT